MTASWVTKSVFVVMLGAALALSQNSAFAQSDADQQQKDLEQKERIYGVKKPWENIMPYGTQYVPPPSGPESVPSSTKIKSGGDETKSIHAARKPWKNIKPYGSAIHMGRRPGGQRLAPVHNKSGANQAKGAKSVENKSGSAGQHKISQ